MQRTTTTTVQSCPAKVAGAENVLYGESGDIVLPCMALRSLALRANGVAHVSNHGSNAGITARDREG